LSVLVVLNYRENASQNTMARELRSTGAVEGLRRALCDQGTAMLDLLFVVILLVSFAGCLAYTVACERL
jgi:hypothetical protein